MRKSISQMKGLAAAYPERIEGWYHDEDGWWIDLKDGWMYDGEVHFVHEDTQEECISAFSRVEKSS